MIKGYYPIAGINENLNKLLRILFSKAQATQSKVRTTMPTADELEENEECYVDDGISMRRKVVKLNGTIRYWNLT